MKQITRYVILLLAAVMMVPNIMNAQDKEGEKKKEKKPFVWEMPEKLTGDETFDGYLLSCDTLWSKIQAYNERITYYKVAQAPTGEVDDTGTPIYQYMVIDDEGNSYKTMQVISQYADWITSGALIILQCTTLSLQTASATTALPSLGFKALTYAKYLKAGPKIVELGGKEIKEMNTSAKKQASAIQALKQASTNTADNKDAVMETSQVPEGVEIVQMTKEELDKKAADAVGEDISGDGIDFGEIFN